MGSVAPDRLRTIAVVGHSHDGKTSLCEALLHTAGATPRLGSPDAGTSILDHEPEEQRRGVSIAAAVAHCEWDGARIHLIDCPGFQDFAGEVAEAVTAADGALMVVSAHGEVPVGLELAWGMVHERALPALIAINKMDKDNADYEGTVDALRAALGKKAIAVAVPIGSAQQFSGFVDLVNDRAYRFDERGGCEEVELPEAMREEVERAHAALMDAAAETDDALIEKYLAGTELSDEEVRGAVHAAALSGTLIPIVPVAAPSQQGAGMLLDAIVRYLPGPQELRHAATTTGGDEVEVACDPAAPFCAQVFKTTVDSFGRSSYFKVLRGTLRADAHPVNARTGQEERLGQLGRPMGRTLEPATEVSAGEVGVVTKLAATRTGDTLCAREAVLSLPAVHYPQQSHSAAIYARSVSDDDRISGALARMVEEDPTFTTDRDPVTNEVLVHGLGDTHLAVALERMGRKYGVEARLETPRVPYRETIQGTARVQYKHKKQSGGAGLYGDCTLEIEPLPRGGGYEWEDRIVGGAIPQQFRPSVEKGVRQVLDQGAVAGYPVVDVRVRLVDGSTHAVDGKDIAFQVAGSMAMRKAVAEAGPVLLEPVMDVVVRVPERLMGDVISLLNAHRGRVGGMNPLGDGAAEVAAQVPQAEMFAFPTDLRAISQGRARYSMTHSHYEEVPAHLAQQLLESHRREHAGAAAG